MQPHERSRRRKLSELPEPLVPPEVDLRGMPFMPLDVHRLRDSDLAIQASGDEFKAALLLWSASWDQIPAASVPNDDKILAALAGHGLTQKQWKRVKSSAMRGFVLCSDGRFYHRVLAEKAIEAWESRVEYRAEAANKDDRKRRERAWRKAAFAALAAKEVIPDWNIRTSELRELVKKEGVTVVVPVTPPITVTDTHLSRGQVTANKGQGSDRDRDSLEAKEAEPNGSGGKPPADKPPNPIFGTGLAFMQTKGMERQVAASVLGMLRKAVGDEKAAELLRQAEAEDISDPKSWLMACAHKAAGTRKGQAPAPLPRDERSDDELAAANLAALEEMRAMDEARA